VRYLHFWSLKLCSVFQTACADTTQRKLVRHEASKVLCFFQQRQALQRGQQAGLLTEFAAELLVNLLLATSTSPQ
jgi:hypothetical protein